MWSAWVGVAALSLLAALWQVGHETYGDFILPSPLATAQAAARILSDTEAWGIALETTRRAVEGFVLAGIVGGLLGLTAGYSPASLRLARPLLLHPGDPLFGEELEA